ncbi:MAG: YncE family protein [Intrasporangium sp.]|uniref:YncE family protein n=1 Tax=Intrasporangium sp. TaxID=1925024 RepID=UPI003F80D09C
MRTGRRPAVLVGFVIVLALALAGCDGRSGAGPEVAGSPSAGALSPAAPVAPGATSQGPSTHPGTAPYAFAGAGMLTGAATQARPLVYVPNQLSGTVQVIDPKTYKVISTDRIPASPEHVVPSWDLRTLWINSDQGNALTPVDPVTGKVGTPVAVADPYNLYFTPDGAHAVVMASRLRRIDLLDPHTMKLQRSLKIPECVGVNHADYTADLQHMLASCEFNGRLLVLDREMTTVLKVIDLNQVRTPGATPPSEAHMMGGPKNGLVAGASAMPQDVRLTPDGKWFMVADMLRNGVWFINASTMRYDHFVPTGMGAHGIYPSRDATRVFVSNRDEGTISVFDATTDEPVTKWKLPGSASPDMGDVSMDGSQLWLSGRYNSEVYVIDTTTGRLLHRIHTGSGPHGLCVWPQPGRFSLGHTGNMR